MNKNIIKYLFLLLIIPSCAKQKQNLQKVNIEKEAPYLSNIPQYYEDKSGIKITIRKLQENDTNLLTSKKVFERYQPIELRIENQSQKTYNLATNNVNLDLISAKKVSRTVRVNLAASVIWPAANITPKKYYANMALSIAVIPLTVFITPVYYLGAIVGSMMTNAALTGRSNQKKTQRFKSNSIEQNRTILIPPRKQVTTLLFTRKEKFKPVFDLKLQSEESNELLTFNINLKS